MNKPKLRNKLYLQVSQRDDNKRLDFARIKQARLVGYSTTTLSQLSLFDRRIIFSEITDRRIISIHHHQSRNRTKHLKVINHGIYFFLNIWYYHTAYLHNDAEKGWMLHNSGTCICFCCRLSRCVFLIYSELVGNITPLRLTYLYIQKEIIQREFLFQHSLSNFFYSHLELRNLV